MTWHRSSLGHKHVAVVIRRVLGPMMVECDESRHSTLDRCAAGLCAAAQGRRDELNPALVAMRITLLRWSHYASHFTHSSLHDQYPILRLRCT